MLVLSVGGGRSSRRSSGRSGCPGYIKVGKVKRPCFAKNAGMCMNVQRCCSTHARPLVGGEALQQVAFPVRLLDRSKSTHLCTNSFHSMAAIIAA